MTFGDICSGCTKLRNATNETKRNETKYYKTQRNILKGETKRNATKRNEIYYNAKRNEMDTTKRNILKCETQ